MPYTQLVNKQKDAYFLNLFDEAVAIHPFSANTYSRLNVFEKFGFDKFHYIEVQMDWIIHKRLKRIRIFQMKQPIKKQLMR